MASPTDVLSAFRLELVVAGLARRASQAGAGPPVLVEPTDGARAPGEAEDPVEDDPNLVLSLFHDGDVSPADNFDAAATRRVVVALRYRTRPEPGASAALRAVYTLDASIRARLIRPANNYGYGFLLGGILWAQSVGVFGGLGRVSSSRETGHDLVAKYVVDVEP